MGRPAEAGRPIYDKIPCAWSLGDGYGAINVPVMSRASTLTVLPPLNELRLPVYSMVRVCVPAALSPVALQTVCLYLVLELYRSTV